MEKQGGIRHELFIKGVALLGFNTPPLGALPAGGAGDLFPRIHKDFKEKSSIPQGLPCGCSSDFSIKCNVLLIGKTGTEKSTFANYLFGVDKFTTGTGAPVTKWEENFQKYALNVSDVQINVYDSVGLEQNAFDRWMRELNKFLSEKQILNFS